MATLRSAGSSTSGTPGTLIAEIERTGTLVLRNLTVFAYAHESSSNQLRVIVTYTDDTTTTVDAPANNEFKQVIGNNAGIQIHRLGSTTSLQTALSDKEIKKVRVETLGSGTGQRHATLSAEEGT